MGETTGAAAAEHPARLSAQLARLLTNRLGLADDAEPTIADLRPLGGGASRQTWSFTANGRPLILRADPLGRPGAPGSLRLEAQVIGVCAERGLAVPNVLAVDDGPALGRAAMVMERVDGESIARRIQRDERFVVARRRLVGQMGAFLAGLHAIPVEQVAALRSSDPVGDLRRGYEHLGIASAVFERALDWLAARRPDAVPEVIVHGDFRLGNLIVADDGLRAVIDWELVHRGDPLEDLAWLCLKAWRFGGAGEAAGLGSIDELAAAYEAGGGTPVDRRRLRWWLVNKTLGWGLGCLIQGQAHRSGAHRSIDLAAVGRRAAEQEWDVVELIEPSATAAARLAPSAPTLADDDHRYGLPTARELLDAVGEFLSGTVATSTDASLAYPARVAASIIAQVERQLAQPLIERPGSDWPTLALNLRDRLAAINPRHVSLPPTLDD